MMMIFYDDDIRQYDVLMPFLLDINCDDDDDDDDDGRTCILELMTV